MRTLAVTVGAVVVAGALTATAADFGTAIYAEHHLSRELRAQAGLAWDPTVAILGFPFVTQAADHRYDEIEIRAVAAAAPVVGRASREATLHGVGLGASSWLVRADAPLPVEKVESRVIISSGELGRVMDMPDLMVEAPRHDTSDFAGGSDPVTESGISDDRDLVFTGTPRAAGFDRPVTVAVDVSVTGADRTVVALDATDIMTGAGTAKQDVPAERRDAVLAAFTTRLPEQRLPFGLSPTSQGVRGSDLIVEGIATGVTVTLDGFR